MLWVIAKHGRVCGTYIHMYDIADEPWLLSIQLGQISAYRMAQTMMGGNLSLDMPNEYTYIHVHRKFDHAVM